MTAPPAPQSDCVDGRLRQNARPCFAVVRDARPTYPAAMDTGEAEALRALDELAIIRTLARVARAQDDLNPAAFRACFTDRVFLPATVMFGDWEPREISGDELTQMVFERLGSARQPGRAGHHMIFNHLIEVEGDSATCDADMYALAVREDGDNVSSAAAGGRYLMRLVRQDGRWLIRERSVTLRYRYGDLALFTGAPPPAPE